MITIRKSKSLTQQQISEIKQMAGQGLKAREIAKKLNIDPNIQKNKYVLMAYHRRMTLKRLKKNLDYNEQKANIRAIQNKAQFLELLTAWATNLIKEYNEIDTNYKKQFYRKWGKETEITEEAINDVDVRKLKNETAIQVNKSLEIFERMLKEQSPSSLHLEKHETGIVTSDLLMKLAPMIRKMDEVNMNAGIRTTPNKEPV